MTTIFRRDLAAYFTSPIGYIFMLVFLAISVGLYITSFFTFPVADMRGYFTNLPLLLCVFIPAVTMRIWAEERKENTWEMLLTFPMRARDLVLGKFAAALVFFAMTLAATFTVPLMLVVLGNPDNGAILGGYLGTFLLGAFFLSIGIFFSGLCKDQIVAFVVTLLACFTIFLLGTNFLASYIDGVVPGLGSLLSEVVGMMNHYGAFTRGVIELADVLYFVAWTALFLWLNMLYIEGRNRPGVRARFATAVVLCAAIGLAFNWLLTGTSLGRADLTEDKIYTVSDASKKILSELDVPVQIKVYATPKNEMPTGYTQLEQDISAKLDELRIASGGKIDFTTVPMHAANAFGEPEDPLAAEKEEGEGEEDEAKSIEERMIEKGVQPFAVRVMEADQVTQKLIYASIEVAYREKKEEIIPQVVPETVPELEYRLVNIIYKLTREEPPVVALVAPKEAINIPPQLRQMYMQMGQPVPTTEDPYEILEQILRYEKYDVQRVELTANSKLPDEYDALVVVNPRELNERQRWEINRALASGKSLVIAVQNYEWDYRVQRDRLNLSKREENPGINELLEKYGLGVSTDILMDVNNVPLTIQGGGGGLAGLLGMGQTIRLSTQMLIHNTSMDQDTAITSRLSSIFYLWGTALEYDQESLDKYGLEVKTLVNTTDGAWSVSSTTTMTQSEFDQPAEGLESYPLMAMVTGQFPDIYKDEARPAWPPPQPQPGMPPMPPPEEDGEVEPLTPAPGKLILIGCSEMFRKNFVTQTGNLDLFLNSVDALTLGDDIINVRGRKPIDRAINMPSAATKTLWKGINYGLMSIIIIIVGIIVATIRRKSRGAYTVAYSRGDVE